MEAEIRRIDRRRHGSDDEDDQRTSKKQKGPSILQQELSKYSRGKAKGKKGKKDETDILASLSSFRTKLQQSFDQPSGRQTSNAPEEGGTGDAEGAEVEVDDDREWLNHELHFAKDNTETEKALGVYDVIDPRVRGQMAKEEEKARRQQKRPQVGRAFQSRGERSGGGGGGGGRR